MSIEQIKKNDLRAFLAQNGITPVKETSTGGMYLSPIRQEDAAGFSGLNFRGGWRSLNVRKIGRFEIAYGMNKVGLIHKHDEVDNGTADTGSVVGP